MLQQGIITPSRSPWRSPVVTVSKPDGTIHLRIDFRKLNWITCFDAFPLPQVGNVLECIEKAKYILTLDLAKGYLQIA